MDNEEKKEMSRREFLTWLAGAAAMFALPGSRGTAQAAVPSYIFADLDLPPVDMPADAILDFPDPPPPIINPPGVVTPPSKPISLSARRSYNHGPYAQYGAYPPQVKQGHTAVPMGYPSQNVEPISMPSMPMYEEPLPTQQPVRQQSIAMPKLSTARRMGPSVQSVPAPVSSGAKVSALSRRMWADVAANPAKMRPMGQVMRLTIHHEGSEKPNNDVLPFDVVDTLRMIHSQHRKRMGAGDIGYHFIIDRTGMIWQGRDWAFQGAHTSGANANNLGVMLLGNFQVQRPTQQQLDSLYRLTGSLMRKYGLNPARDIYGHSDFCKTHCPGTNLRPQLDILRRMSL